jgi:hypothetical protein
VQDYLVDSVVRGITAVDDELIDAPARHAPGAEGALDGGRIAFDLPAPFR